MKSNKGSALVTVILTFTVLSILAVTLITVITARMHLTVSYADSTGALYAAQAGLEKMKLDISNKISSPTFKVDVQRYVQDYLDIHPGATDDQLSAVSNDATEQYLYNNYLASLASSQLNSGNMLVRNTASYEILPFSNVSSQGNSYYDKANGIVIIRSKGTYGKSGVTKTVALTLRLSSSPSSFTDTGGSGGGTVKWQDIPNYSILVSNPGSSQYSFKGYCQSLTVNGDFYIPKGMDGLFDASSNFVADFNGKLTVYDNLTLGAYAQQITVRDGMSVNGDLTLGPSAMRLIIENGDLVVNGNIVINGYNNQINLLNGNLRCNGNIIFDTKNGTSSQISIAKDLYIKGTESYAWGSSINLTGSNSHKYTNSYGGTINPAPINTLSTSAFSASNIIKTSSINTTTDYGSLNNPVIIYSDGDLNINLPWNDTGDYTLNIYGLVYAKGKINISSYGNPTNFNMYGPMISEKGIAINDYLMTAKFEYDGNKVMKGLIRDYPGVISAIYSGFLTASPTTRNVYVTNGFISTKWDE